MSKIDKNIVIRDMNRSEKSLVRQLLIDSYIQYEKHFEKERWKRYLTEVKEAVDNEQIETLLVATYDEDIVGTIQIYSSSDEAYEVRELQIDAPIIRFLAVHPRGRGLGLAQKLLDQAVAYTKRVEAEAIYLHTTDVMTKAVQLYEKYGFIRDQSHDYFKQGNLIKCFKFIV